MGGDDFIPLCIPFMGGNERAYLNQCIDSNFVSSVGPFVDRFEQEFAAFVGVPRAVACVNGTAALHIALILAGVGPGDEVLVPTFTFIATINPVKYLGAEPVFVDAEAASWNMDPDLVAQELEDRKRHNRPMPKAVVVAHLLGHPANIAPVAAICKDYGIPLIEDAAESLGATWDDGVHPGTIGDFGAYSFNGNKIMTTGGGGMIVCRSEGDAARAKHLTTQARMPGVEYNHDEVGYNYRLTNLAAALGVAQLEQLSAFVADKRRIAAGYDAALTAIDGMTPPPSLPWARPSFWLYSALVNTTAAGMDRTALLEALQKEGIQTRPLWHPVHTMDMYRRCRFVGGGVADDLFARGLSLPCSVGLTPAQQDRVTGALARIMNAGS